MPPTGAVQHEARETIREALSPFGYDLPCVRFGWQTPNSEMVRRYTSQDDGDPEKFPTGQARLLDALAFADPKRQDWNTSAIAVDLCQDSVVATGASQEQARELFRLTAAPTNLIGSLSRKKVDVWFNCHDGIVGLQGVDFAPEPLKAAFQKHRPSVQRERLAQLRLGQQHLFDGYLYARRDELASFLQRGVSKATWVVGGLLWGKNDEQTSALRESFSRVALALLAARILEDKGALGEDRGQSTDSRRLLAEAQVKWDSFFDIVVQEDLVRLDAWFQPKQTDLMLRCLLSHLTGPVNFGLVTHEMLGDLYERALVAERSVGSDTFVELKGVHYTPLAIARRILDRIPLEDLPVPYRTVCDFSCGSGSFLLAATDRLIGLFDPREPGAGDDRTTWLQQAVMGNDIDPVATLVARLSYLVAYWNRVDDTSKVPFPVLHERGNALTLDPVAAFGRSPTVIVGNPPFDLSGHPASEFLDRALTILLADNRPVPGYIGMVMPGAFLKGKKEQEAVRTRLLQHVRILEVWELPEQAIGLCADTPTSIIIAEVNEAKPPIKQFVRVCQTISRRTEAVKALRDTGVTTWSYAGEMGSDRNSGEGDPSEILAFSSIDDIWTRLFVQGPVVSAVAEAVWGFLHTKLQGKPDPEFSSSAERGCVPYVREQSALRPFVFSEEDWHNSHRDLQIFWKKGTGPRPCEPNWPNYESPKIIISAQSNRNALSQLVAALDFGGYYPGKHFLVVTLRTDWKQPFESAFTIPADSPGERDVLRWLCGILNSPIGHAWFAKHAGPRGPQADVCLTLPLPHVYNPAIAESVGRLETLARPENIGSIPTWSPTAGLLTPTGDLFGEADEAVRRNNDFWQAVAALNDLVLASYGLSDSECVRLITFMKGMVDPWVEHGPDVAQLKTTKALRVLRGKTLSLDALTQTLEVEFSWKSLGNEHAVSIPIPKFMPGWALQAGREFTCRAPIHTTLEQVRTNPWLLREFAAVPYPYLSTEQLAEMVGYRAGVPKP